MKRQGSGLSKFALPIVVLALSAMVGLLLPFLSGGGREAAEPWTPPTPTSTSTATATATFTVTPVQTHTVAPTRTPSPSATPAPTATPEVASPTSTPEPEKVETTAQVNVYGLNLRNGPGAASTIVGAAVEGDRFTVVGKTADSAWLRVCCLNEQMVWLSSDYVNLSSELQAVPVVP